MKYSMRIVAILLLIALLAAGCAETAILAPDPLAIRLHTERQAEYLADKFGAVASYADGTKELSRPLPALIKLSDDPNEYLQVEYSESVTFDDPFVLPVTAGTAEIYNLKVGVTYYYRGIKASGERGEIGAIRADAALPRNLFIDGVTNARDLGGYETPNGKVRQGLLYRTAKLNKNKTEAPTPLITEGGIDTMLNVLKVKTEIDLRLVEDNEIGGLTASVLGPTVTYLNCPMTYGANMPFANDDSIRKIFRTLSQKESYPLFFHCSIGTDRTGFIAFLALTLLGVSAEEIYRDYLFSNFGKIGRNRSVLNVMVHSLFLSQQEGEDYAEKAENYLLNLGVTEAEIEAFRDIMIEKK
ncbi:MAG: tyrosine-protein phosphatase [Clostridia bacterium]|nr:tyrosine-protein phosphatase [Clostridia bacterium]